MNWKVVHEAANLLAVLAGLVVYFRKSTTQGTARVRDDKAVVFAPEWVSYLELPLVLLPPVLASLAAEHYGVHSREDLFTSAAITFAAVAYLFAFPGTIVATWEGLEQLYWLRPEKRIRWDEIAEIKSGGNTGTLTIKKADGTAIVHSVRLPDRERLLDEIRLHCGSNLPPGFPSGRTKTLFS